MNTLADDAVAKFLEGYNCAQAVLHASCPRLGFDRDTALRLATGFGAGMGRKEEVCGAVSGGIIALGLAGGRGENQDRSHTETTYARTRELMDRFAARHGAVICRQLLGGCDLLTEAGQARYKAEGLLRKTCVPCVQTAAELVDALLPRSPSTG